MDSLVKTDDDLSVNDIFSTIASTVYWAICTIFVMVEPPGKGPKACILGVVGG